MIQKYKGYKTWKDLSAFRTTTLDEEEIEIEIKSKSNDEISS